MNNKVNTVLLIILSGIIGVLVVMNMKQRKKIEELSTEKQNVAVNPLIPETKPANPPGVSPFEKPNVDPLADQFNGPSGTTKIRFDHLEHDFGVIKEGEIVSTKFRFTNSGDVGLLISTAKGSCGCTVPNWPTNPIKPGESADIDVQFDSHGKHGETSKTVTVTANTNPAATVLTIKSTIKPAGN